MWPAIRLKHPDGIVEGVGGVNQAIRRHIQPNHLPVAGRGQLPEGLTFTVKNLDPPVPHIANINLPRLIIYGHILRVGKLAGFPAINAKTEPVGRRYLARLSHAQAELDGLIVICINDVEQLAPVIHGHVNRIIELARAAARLRGDPVG